MLTWAELIELEQKAKDDGPIIYWTLTDKQANRKFDTSFGDSEGVYFTAWSKNRVYFPATYDGAEWVASVPRNPCDEVTVHVGGE